MWAGVMSYERTVGAKTLRNKQPGEGPSARRKMMLQRALPVWQKKKVPLGKKGEGCGHVHVDRYQIIGLMSAC